MEPTKPQIGDVIEVDASHILKFDCGHRSWIEAVVDSFGPGERDMVVRIGDYVNRFVIDYFTNSHGPSWRIPIWSPLRREEIAKAMCRKLLREDGLNIEGWEKLEPNKPWWRDWLREADGVLNFLEIGPGRFPR